MSPILRSLITTFVRKHARVVADEIAMIIIVRGGLLFMRRRREDMGVLPDGDKANPATGGKDGIAIVQSKR